MTQRDYEQGMRYIVEDERGLVFTGEGWSREYVDALQHDTQRAAGETLRTINNHPYSAAVRFAYF